MKKNSGKMIDGRSERRVVEEVVDVRARRRARRRRARRASCPRHPRRAGAREAANSADDGRCHGASRSRAHSAVASQPVMTSVRSPRPCRRPGSRSRWCGTSRLLDQVARQRHRRQEEEHEEEREHALHRLARAGAQRRRTRRARAKPSAISSASASSTSAPPTPAAMCSAGDQPDGQVGDRADQRRAATRPPSWPTSSALPRSGVSAAG